MRWSPDEYNPIILGVRRFDKLSRLEIKIPRRVAAGRIERVAPTSEPLPYHRCHVQWKAAWHQHTDKEEATVTKTGPEGLNLSLSTGV